MTSQPPAWFDAGVYFNNKLASLGEGWSAEGLREAFKGAGYDMSGNGMYKHFVDFGNGEGISPNPDFDPSYYLASKAAHHYNTQNVQPHHVESLSQILADNGMTAWDHYQQFGWKEGFNPSANFDAAQYMQNKLSSLGHGWSMGQLQDAIENAGMNPLTHYHSYGKNEGVTHHKSRAMAESGISGDGNDIIALDLQEPDTLVLNRNFGKDFVFGLQNDDTIDVSALFKDATVPTVGVGEEYKQDGGITIRTVENGELNHVFSVDEFMRMFGGNGQIGEMQAGATSMVILRDDQAYTFFLLENDGTAGAGAADVSLIGVLMTDGGVIDAGMQFAA